MVIFLATAAAGSRPISIFSFRRGLWRNRLFRSGARSRLRHLHGKRVRGSEHVRPEHNPLLIWSEADVRLQSVSVLGHVYQAFRTHHARIHEALVVYAAV